MCMKSFLAGGASGVTGSLPTGIKAPVLALTDDQKRQVREAIQNAATKEEIDVIERQLKTGAFVFKSDVSSDSMNIESS